MRSPNTPLRSVTRAAFTLVELLTVIAIIGILAAILIPTVGKIRAAATKATCAGNLRHLATSSLLFANDNKKLLPTREATQSNHWATWRHPHVYSQPDYLVFRPYLGGGEGDRETIPSLFCPGPLKDYRNSTSNTYHGPEGLFITYAYYNQKLINPAILTAYGMTSGNDLRRTNTISPNFPLWSCLSVQLGSNYMDHDTPNQPGGFSGQNVASADGSVRWVAGDQLVPYITEGANIYHGPRP